MTSVQLASDQVWESVDLVHLYSKREMKAARPRLVLTATATPRPPEPERHRRQRQRRLNMTEVSELIKKYEQQVPVKELAEQFGIHRTTVTAILQRQRAGYSLASRKE